MDMQKTVREIGMFETGINLSKVCDSTDVLRKIGDSMPLPDEYISENVPRLATWLKHFGKRKYLFLTPEIALIEEMAKLTGPSEVIIAIPCDLETEAKERIRNNLPHDIEVTILEEPYFPPSFFPGNSMIVVCGYSAGERAMVLPDTYRMLEHYRGFLGKIVFIPYQELSTAVRYDGWMEVNPNRLSVKWRRDHE